MMRGPDFKPASARRLREMPGRRPPGATDRALVELTQAYGETPREVPAYQGNCTWKRRRNARLQKAVNDGKE